MWQMSWLRYVTNTTCQQHPRRLYTWTSPGDRVRNQIDYILIGRRWRSTILVTKKSADCGSDHQLLVAKIKIKLRQKKRRSVPVRYDIETIPHFAVTNRFAALLRVAEEEQTPNELWEEAKEVMGHFHKKGQITVKTWRSIFNHVATRYLCISIDIYMPCDTYVL